MDRSKPKPKEPSVGTVSIKPAAPYWVRIGIVAGAVVIVLSLFFIIISSSNIIALFPSTLELPISRLDTIALDQQGRIYTHSRFTMRVQVYTPEGQFIRGFSVRASVFRIGPQQIIRTQSGNKMFTYTLAGELVGEEPFDRANYRKEFEDRPDDKVTDSDGNVYRVMSWPSYNPRVEKLSPNGDREVIISQPLWMGFIQSAPGFICFFCGLGLVMICHHVKSNCEKRLLDSQPGKDQVSSG